MGKKRSIKDVVYDTKDNLSVPPGFMSLASLTLKRTVAVCDAADHMAVAGLFKPGLIGASLGNSDIQKFKASFVQRRWICHDQLDRVPQNHDRVQSEADTVLFSRQCYCQ